MLLHPKRTHAVILDPKISSVWAGYWHAGYEIAMDDFCWELNFLLGFKMVEGLEIIVIYVYPHSWKLVSQRLDLY